MRLVFVNPTHPLTPHISGVRAWRFAEELAKSGHQVVLLCATLDHSHTAENGGLDGHDWRKPYVLACAPGGSGKVEPDTLPTPARKAATMWYLLRYGGRMAWWTTEAEAAAGRLIETFRPDVIWATFGRMEAVVVARRIARSARCPWVLDIKDNWELYVPAGLRWLMVVRTKGWAGLTANARFTQEKGRIWQGGEATVIYSGVDSAFFKDYAQGVHERNRFCINLIGGIKIYDNGSDFFRGLKRWVDGLGPEERGKVHLRHIGEDDGRFWEIASRADLAISVDKIGYIPVNEMARYCRCSAMNVYYTHGSTFHHKLLELLACGRPVIAYPTELEESRDLARHVGGELLTPVNPAAVASELERLHRRWREGGLNGPALETAREFSWAAQSVKLEQVLKDAASIRLDERPRLRITLSKR